jgi:hypothetical protein
MATRSTRNTAIASLTAVLALAAVLKPAFGQPAAAGDPDAMRKIAATVPKLDIVGIRLGMTPEEATAAIKAADPKLKVDLVYTRLERPDTQGFTRVPHWMIAHTVGVANFHNASDGSAEVIAVQFTTPPARSVVSKVVREVTFPRGQPVPAANLRDALHKKYGDLEDSESASMVWGFDASGKLLAKPWPAAALPCRPANPWTGLDDMANSWRDYDPARDYGDISLISTPLVSHLAEEDAACVPYTLAQGFTLGSGIDPKQLMKSMTVAIESPALLYGSRKATHEWLQQLADDLKKQQDAAGAKRSAPKL